MDLEKVNEKELYYTKDHEWIVFKETVAYVGISFFKLLGFKEIQHIRFSKTEGILIAGEQIATVGYLDYEVEVNMPVNGKIIQVNEALLAGNLQLLINEPIHKRWIVMIKPSDPESREDFLESGIYLLNKKSKIPVFAS